MLSWTQKRFEVNRVRYFGYGVRNERDEMLYNFLEQVKLHAMNTYFRKKPQNKWPWMNPNGESFYY